MPGYTGGASGLSNYPPPPQPMMLPPQMFAAPNPYEMHRFQQMFQQMQYMQQHQQGMYQPPMA